MDLLEVATVLLRLARVVMVLLQASKAMAPLQVSRATVVSKVNKVTVPLKASKVMVVSKVMAVSKVMVVSKAMVHHLNKVATTGRHLVNQVTHLKDSKAAMASRANKEAMAPHLHPDTRSRNGLPLISL